MFGQVVRLKKSPVIFQSILSQKEIYKNRGFQDFFLVFSSLLETLRQLGSNKKREIKRGNADRHA